MKDIFIKGLTQNNLKNVTLSVPKEKITVFTGVSGSGKSSIVFDTIAAESQRQMKETYPAFIRSRLPKYTEPHVEIIRNLSPSVIVDQSSLGGNARSTVGTSTQLYNILRLLFSRMGEPYVGSSTCFSFNDPSGMCPVCGGLGKTTEIDIKKFLDPEKSWNEGCIKDSMYIPGKYYWRKYANSGLFDLDKKLKDFTPEEYKALLYGAGENPKIEGIYNNYIHRFLNRDLSSLSKTVKEKSDRVVKECRCSACGGKRLNPQVLSCKIMGHSIADLCDMELTELYDVLSRIENKNCEALITSLMRGIKRIIDIGMPYLSLSRGTTTLSGGEAQRLKLVRYMGSSLSGLTYIFDEPSTGLHPRDVYRMNNLLRELRDAGNTVLVVEHDADVISIADEVVDVGPNAGEHGGNIVFQGTYGELLKADTLTSRALAEKLPLNTSPLKSRRSIPVRGAKLHNLKDVDVDIPLDVLTVVTGVAGSGKSTLITQVFAKEHEDQVVLINQGPITATNRSTPSSYLGFFDDIRKLFAEENHVSESFFSFNSEGACPVCKGKGVVVTELAYMDPIVNKCEACDGQRYSKEALSYTLEGKNIIEVLSLTASEALKFFKNQKILKKLRAMNEVGLEYLTLGQPLSTLSGGERQRIKLAKQITRKGDIYILDEPTTGLHPSDIGKLLKLFRKMIKKGKTIILIEHNLDVIKQADWIIDIGPDGGKNGGQIVFEGTPEKMLKSGETITADCLRNSI